MVPPPSSTAVWGLFIQVSYYQYVTQKVREAQPATNIIDHPYFIALSVHLKRHAPGKLILLWRDTTSDVGEGPVYHLGYVKMRGIPLKWLVIWVIWVVYDGFFHDM